MWHENSELENGDSGSLVFCSGRTGGFGSGDEAASRDFLDDVRKEWKLLWRTRLDDKVRAEGLASRDYSLLFVERGTVISATRGFRPLDLTDILRVYKVQNFDRIIPPDPSVGGWGKFARSVLNKQNRNREKIVPVISRNRNSNSKQLKKGGRGWLHL